MAYGKKYSQWLEKEPGQRIILNIYEKDYTGSPFGIANITDLRIETQGGQSPIYVPIVKTSLVFSLVDAFDEGETVAGVSCVKDGAKCGQWEEFYTSDATRYKVELCHANGRAFWTGFVTPDSWAEDMTYRGSVTVTARDMLGSLSDSEFDMQGLVSIRQLITAAIQKSQSAMDWTATNDHLLKGENGKLIIDHSVSAVAYGGKTWYAALETTLEALGLILRYNGANGYTVESIRYAGSVASEGHLCRFVNRSGYRQLDPAVRQIVEVFEVKTSTYDAIDPDPLKYTDTGVNLRQTIVTKYDSGATGSTTQSIKKYNLAAPANGEGWQGSLLFPGYGNYELADGVPDRTAYVPTDVITGETATFKNPRIHGAFNINIGVDGSLLFLNFDSRRVTVANPNRHGIESITARISCRVGSTVRWYQKDGTWSSYQGDLTITPGEDFFVADIAEGEDYSFVLVNVASSNTAAVHYPMVAPLIFTFAQSENTGVYSEYKTTLNYQDSNNVVIKREPVVGSADTEAAVDFVPNLLSYNGKVVENKWRWAGMSQGYPLSVMVCAQYLQMYAAANSIFTGTLMDSQERMAMPLRNYSYYERPCVLVSGTFNFLTGFIDDACLRQVTTWESVWGASFTPSYVTIGGAGKGSTNTSGSATSGSTGSGGSSVSLKDVVRSETIKRLEMVTQYPETLEDGTAYFLVS